MKKLVILSFIIVMSLFSACGKKDNGLDGEFYTVISSNPKNLDPQMAQDKQSLFIIKNIFSTLMDIDEDGRVVCAAAESYDVSGDGLVYTFRLRDGLCWYCGGENRGLDLTAYDYEYAFARIYSKETFSPHTKMFSCIKNSMAVYSGEKSPEELGVRAEDKLTLIVELGSPNCDFLRLMAHPASSPCCKELFLSTQGRYGLSKDDTCACGAFYLSDWNYDPYWTDNHLTLERINANSQPGFETCPLKVNVAITDSRTEYEKQRNYRTDVFTVSRRSEYGSGLERSYLLREYLSGTTCLFMSKSFHSREDSAARNALFSAVDRKKFSGSPEENVAASYGLIPDGIMTGGRSFRELFPRENRTFSADSTVPESLAAVNDGSTVLLVCDNIGSQSLPYGIVSDFEEKLDFYCTVYFENESDFSDSVSEGKYGLFLDTVSADINLAEIFLQNVYLRSGFDDPFLETLIGDMSRCRDVNEKKDVIKKAEDHIIGSAYALPLCFEKKYLVTGRNVSGVCYDPFTDIIYFKYARKNV